MAGWLGRGLMDMSPFAVELTVRCPRAALIFVLFHVVAKYSREVLDRIRVDEMNKLAKAAGPNRPGGVSSIYEALT